MDWPFPRLPQWSLSAYKVTWDEIVWIFHEKVRKREIMLPISTDTYITHSGLCTSVADNSLSVHSYLAQCKLHRCSKKKCWIGPELRTLKTKYHCARSLCFDKFGWKVGWNCWKSEMTRTKYMFLNDLLSMDYRLKDGSLLEWSRSVWNCVKCKAAIFKLLSHWRCLLMSLGGVHHIPHPHSFPWCSSTSSDRDEGSLLAIGRLRDHAAAFPTSDAAFAVELGVATESWEKKERKNKKRECFVTEKTPLYRQIYMQGWEHSVTKCVLLQDLVKINGREREKSDGYCRINIDT